MIFTLSPSRAHTPHPLLSPLVLVLRELVVWRAQQSCKFSGTHVPRLRARASRNAAPRHLPKLSPHLLVPHPRADGEVHGKAKFSEDQQQADKMLVEQVSARSLVRRYCRRLSFRLAFLGTLLRRDAPVAATLAPLPQLGLDITVSPSQTIFHFTDEP